MAQLMILYIVLLIFIVNEEIHCTNLFPEDEYRNQSNKYFQEINDINGVLDSISNDSRSQLMGMKNDELTIIGVTVNNAALDIRNMIGGYHEMGQLSCRMIAEQALPQIQFESNMATFHCFANEESGIKKQIEFERLFLNATRRKIEQIEKMRCNTTIEYYNKMKCCTFSIEIEKNVELSGRRVGQLQQSIQKNGYGEIKLQVRNCMLPITANSTKSLGDVKKKLMHCLETSEELIVKESTERKGHPIHKLTKHIY